MDESGQQKTAIAMHKDLFHFKVIPFALSNSPSTFERLVEAFLSGMQWKRCVRYLEDIVIFGSLSDKKKMKSLTYIFYRLHSAFLILEPRKCSLFQEQASLISWTYYIPRWHKM